MRVQRKLLRVRIQSRSYLAALRTIQYSCVSDCNYSYSSLLRIIIRALTMLLRHQLLFFLVKLPFCNYRFWRSDFNPFCDFRSRNMRRERNSSVTRCSSFLRVSSWKNRRDGFISPVSPFRPPFVHTVSVPR